MRRSVGDLGIVEIEGDHLVTGGEEAFAHRPAHVAKANEPDDVAVAHVFPVDLCLEPLVPVVRSR